jgi:integrase
MGQKLQRVERNLYLDTDTGIYHVRAMVNGKAYGPFSTFQTTLKMALRKRDTIMSDLQARGEAAKEVPTLKEQWESYRKRKTKAAGTWRGQETRMSLRLLPTYGHHRLNEFSKAQMEFYVQKLRKQGLAEGTIAQDIRLLKAILNDALDNGLIERNPLRKFKGPKIGKRERILTPEEQDKIEAVASPEARRFLLFVLATGVRVEEAATIVPSSDFNWETGEFRVLGKGRKHRWVPILKTAESAVKRIVTEQLELTGKDQLWTRGKDALRELLYRTCVRAGVDKLGPHALRHTFATRYLQGDGRKGGDIFILSQILGHASVLVTQLCYAHLIPRDLAERSSDVELGVHYGS